MIDNNEAIDNLIKNSVREMNIPGASYSLLSEDEISTHYIGYQENMPNRTPLRPGMLYDLASLTKVVGTTTRILQLVEQGQIKLTDHLDKYIPDTTFGEVTIKELLMHSSGLPADIKNKHDMNQSQLIGAIKNSKLINESGKKILYSDIGYILLGFIIEIIDGNLSESLRQNVFLPMDMIHTTYKPNATTKELIVPTEYQKSRGGLLRGEVSDYKAFSLNGVSGHAGLFSSLNDMNKFVQMYLHNGEFNHKRILDSKTINLFSKNYQDGRTLGWKQWNPKHLELWHTGFTGTSIALDLEQKRGFVCLTNRVYPNRQDKKWLDTRRLAIGLFFNRPEVIGQ
ncbi:serine hydrolase domain-containing protein [Companilactobacillus huachuanensis]|uniref:Serine hydrolase domain-containing protein n=1 Tax=Companilactobacillus huachuanensis TaxID=2559914 RepID=A0ABW1RPK4_9LACO|nr:serine hydrolase domain-containing protein [Companilactobacillus huachuanensis]